MSKILCLGPATCTYENGKYLASIKDDSAIICDEVIKSYDEEIKTIPTIFNKKKVTFRTQTFYILPAFFLITIKLLIAVSTYCYVKKYQAKHLLPFQSIKNESNSLLLVWIGNEC